MTTKFRTVQSKFRIREAQHALAEGKQRRNMMQGGTIVQRKANTFIPIEYLEKVLAANPRCWGASMVTNEGLQCNFGDTGADLDFIKDSMKTFADKDITFYFGNADTALSEQDIPPYILIAKDGDNDETIPVIAGFFDGNFPSFDKPGSSHPPEYHLAIDYMVPKLEGLMEMCDNDLDKVVEQMKKKHFRDELLLTSVSRGTITLVCANGACLSFAQKGDERVGDFPWGWVSNTHGYVETKPKAEEEKKPEKKSLFPSRSTVRERAPALAPDPEPTTFPKGAVAEDKLAQATAAAKTETAVKGFKIKKWGPSAAASRREKKDQYKTRIGHLPRGWETGVTIDVIYDDNDKLVTFGQIKALGLKATEVMALLKNNPPSTKDTEPDQVQPKDTLPVTQEGKKVSGERLPIMAPATREHIKKLRQSDAYKKIIAENADMILDPAKVQALEGKFADFARQVAAESIDEFIKWDYEQFHDLGVTRVDGLAVMAWTFRNIIAAHRTKEIKAEVKMSETPPTKSLFPKKSAAA